MTYRGATNDTNISRPRSRLQDGTCVGCGFPHTSPFFDLKDIPANCVTLFRDEKEARRCSRGNIGLSHCPACGLVFNREFDPLLIEYDASFENSQEFSPSFRAYADDLAKRLIRDYDLQGKNIVEIGSGNGDFLERLSVADRSQCLGYDPSFQGSEGERGKVRIVKDYYSERYASRPIDFLCCRHVLEHFAAPYAFLSNLKKANAGREIVTYFEVPNGAFVLEGLGLWDLIYQHVCYFNLESLLSLFSCNGFEVLNAGSAFSDQFLFIEARLAAQQQPSEIAAKTIWRRGLAHMTTFREAFGRRHREMTSRWAGFFKSRSDAGQRVAFWGVGSKGASFLNMIPGAGEIAAVVDSNVRKQGTYVSGTGQMIRSLDYLKQYRPDIVVTLNPVYVAEIRSTLSSLGVEARVVIEPDSVEACRLSIMPTVAMSIMMSDLCATFSSLY